MKIRRIQLRNLNSLRTEVAVDFVHGPLAHAGLFAITGDTGSGKTTLLDAVTLALYGKTARLHEAEAMSFGAAEAAAEVEFEAKTGIFRAKWAQTRPKGGAKPRPPVRELAQLDPMTGEWAVVASGKADVDSTSARRGQVEEVCGLNFDQFCRSALLAQGDFEAFLRASEGDRSALLERLTDTSIYSELSKKAFERTKAERQRLEKLEDDRARLDLLDDDAAAQLVEKQRIATELSEKLGAEAEQLRAAIAHIERLELLEKKAAALGAQQAELSKKEADSRPDLARLERHRTAQPLAAEALFFDEKKAEGERLSAEIEVLETESGRLDELKKEAAGLLAKSEAELLAFKKRQPEAEKALREMEAADEKILSKKEKADAAEVELAFSREKLETAQAELSTATDQQIAAAERLLAAKNWLSENENLSALTDELPKFRAIEEQLVAIVADGQGSRARLGDAEKAQKELAEKQAAAERSLENLRVQHAENQSFIVEAIGRFGLSADPDAAAETLAQRIEQQAALVAAMRVMADVAGRHWQLLQQLSATDEQLASLETELRQAERDLLSAIDFERGQRAVFEEARERAEQVRAALEYARARALLTDGQPCPVCGSTEHPLSAHGGPETGGPGPLEAAFFENLGLAEAAFLEAGARVRSLGGDARSMAERLRFLEENRAKTEEAEAGFLPKIAETLASISGENEAGHAAFGNRDELASAIEKEAQSLDNQRVVRDGFLQKVKTANQLARQIEAAQSGLNEVATAIAANSETIQNLTAERGRMLADFEKKQLGLVAGFARFGAEFSWPKRGEAFEKLAEKRAAFETAERRAAADAADLREAEVLQKSLAGQVADLQKQVAARQKAAEAEATDLQEFIKKRREKFGDRAAETEREALAELLDGLESTASEGRKFWEERQAEAIATAGQLSQKRAQLAETRAKSAEVETILGKKLAAAGLFSNIDELREAILGDDEAQQIELFFKNLKEERTRWEQSFSENRDALVAERGRGFLEKKLDGEPQDPSELRQKLAEAEAERQRALQETGHIQARLDDQKNRRAQAAELAQSIENQRVVSKKWARLSDLIGSADGKKFRAFAQSLTLDRLVALANRHLDRLNGRYSLRTSGEDLKLETVDAYQADNVRPMNTLSGGETFLVSLALALGLADLAGRRAQIKSLFIDEGFGTLDEAALSLAIQVLDNLQGDGIKIGIVSHVKELKEKIFPQVNVYRQGNGVSAVRILEVAE